MNGGDYNIPFSFLKKRGDNKSNTKYSRLEFQNNRFRLLNGAII